MAKDTERHNAAHGELKPHHTAAACTYKIGTVIAPQYKVERAFRSPPVGNGKEAKNRHTTRVCLHVSRSVRWCTYQRVRDEPQRRDLFEFDAARKTLEERDL